MLICPKSLTFSLWNCNLSDNHANILLQFSISNIRELYIDQNPGISEMFFAGLIGEDSNIRTLSIRSNNIGDSGAKAISGALKVNHSLAVLNLWDNHIGRDGAEDLADVSYHSELIFEALKSNQNIISLSLAKNHIDDAAILAFATVFYI